MSGHERKALGRELPWALLAIAIISGLVLTAEHLGWLNGIEMASLDALVRFQRPLPDSSNLFIVEITDADYERYFHGVSPLDPDELGKVLRAVLDTGANVVAVDIDTAASSMSALNSKWRLGADPRLVWASVPAASPASESGEEATVGAPGNVMGSPLVPGMRYGLPLFPAAADCKVRQYQRTFQSADGPVNSLAWEIVKAMPSPAPHGGNEVILNFHGTNDQFPAIQAGEFLRDPNSGPKPNFGVLRGKTVLVGGSYAAARDEYLTAVGRMPGVELMAYAVESDLTGGGVREFFTAGALAIDFGLGILIVLCFYFIKSVRTAFWVSLVGTSLLALAASGLAFRAAFYWIDFVPLLIAMLLHQLLDHAVRYRELQKEVEELKQKLAARP